MFGTCLGRAWGWARFENSLNRFGTNQMLKSQIQVAKPLWTVMARSLLGCGGVRGAARPPKQKQKMGTAIYGIQTLVLESTAATKSKLCDHKLSTQECCLC